MVGRSVTHADQKDLNVAVEGAVRRPVGPSGVFAWDRSGALAAAPLTAVSLALYCAGMEPVRTGGAGFYIA